MKIKNRRVKGLLLGSIIVSASWSLAEEGPDLSKEIYFHNLYKNFNSSPTDTTAWSQAKRGKAEKIDIGKSDTLWKISEILFGDPYFWPKIWSLNSEKIENPHQIFPHQTIRFTAGSLTQPPSLALEAEGTKPEEAKMVTVESQVLAEQTEVKESVPAPVANAAEQAPVAKEESSDVDLDPKVIELMGLANLPLGTESSTVVHQDLPKSLPNWVFAARRPRLKFEAKSLSKVPKASSEPVRFFISKDEIKGVGEFAGTEMGFATGTILQHVQLKIQDGVQDRKFYAVSYRGKVNDPVSGDKGYVYQYEGIVEKLDSVNSGERLYRGQILDAILPVQKGALLVPGDVPQFQQDLTDISAAKATLIGGEQESVRRLLQQGSIVFLSGEGLNSGTSYPIYRKNALRVDDNMEFENPRKIGFVKIIQTSEKFATGVIVSASEEIQVGDVTDPSLITLK